MHLIFDFDGTLVDSFQCVMQKTILLADEFNFRKIKEEEIEGLRNLTSKEVIKHLQIPIYKIPSLILKMRAHLFEEMKTLNPVAGMPKILKELHAAGFTMGILTSNSEENARLWLAQHQLDNFFKFIRIESKYFSKKTVLKKTLRSFKIDPAQTFYICDETRDVEAAHKNHVKSIAVTWGYNSEKTLKQCEPTHVARKPAELLMLCGVKETA